MTVSEFTFLALGLVLGLASGIALVEIVRARPPARREVRVTVAQDAIPRRRPATLADDAFVAVGPEPARGGPADRRELDQVPVPVIPDRRTNVRSSGLMRGFGGPPGVAVPVVPDDEPAFRIQPLDGPRSSGPRAGLVGITVSSGEDPAITALRASIVAAAARAAPAPVHRRTAVALLEPEPPATRMTPDLVGLVRCPRRHPTSPRRPSPPSVVPRNAAWRTSAASWRLERGHAPTRRRTPCNSPTERMTRTWPRPSRLPGVVTHAPSGRPRKSPSGRSRQPATRLPTRTRWRGRHETGCARSTGSTVRHVRPSRRRRASGLRPPPSARRSSAWAWRRTRPGSGPRPPRRPASRPVRRSPNATSAQAIDPGAYLLPPRPPVPTQDRPDADEVLGIAMEAGATPRIFRLLRGDRTAMTTLVGALAADHPDQCAHPGRSS